jgi:hypothetical protein
MTRVGGEGFFADEMGVGRETGACGSGLDCFTSLMVPIAVLVSAASPSPTTVGDALGTLTSFFSPISGVSCRDGAEDASSEVRDGDGSASLDLSRFMILRPRVGTAGRVGSGDGEGEGVADSGCWNMGGCRNMLFVGVIVPCCVAPEEVS